MYDVAIIGGGFYGCCLALWLRSRAERVVVVEREDALLKRASRVNQARVHTGFHYPRSFVTALRSRVLQSRFAADFADAVVDDFTMLYAIAARRSKVSAHRFYRMFVDMGAPIEPASARDRALFDRDAIADVFVAREFAFDWTALRDHLSARMAAAGVEVRTGAEVEQISVAGERAVLALSRGGTVEAETVFNVTYAGLNALLLASGRQALPLKHEFTEIALVEPPEEFSAHAVTVMDGPFFSMMPYPSRGLHSLTHVRYTPHYSWVDEPGGASPYAIAQRLRFESRWRHMVADAQRYVPSIAQTRYRESITDVKTVLTRNERDDGRPILFKVHGTAPGVYSVMGGKIDNIYDLFDVLPEVDPRFARTNARYLLGVPA